MCNILSTFFDILVIKITYEESKSESKRLKETNETLNYIIFGP